MAVALLSSDSMADLLPFTGNISVNIRIANATIPASFGAQTISSAEQSFSIVSPAGNFGEVSLRFAFNPGFTGGAVQIFGSSASLDVDAIGNRLTIRGFNKNFVSQLGEFSFLEGAIERQVFTDIIQEGKKVGEARIVLRLTAAEPGERIAELRSEGSVAGAVTIRANMEPLIDQTQGVTNLFAGFVSSQNGNPIRSGTVRVISTGGEFSAPIRPVGDKGGFGFLGNPLVVSGIAGSNVAFFVEDFKAAEVQLTSEQGVREVNLVVPITTSGVNFADWDLDGVPNGRDKCPETWRARVNSDGCSCAQLLALNDNKGSCEETADKGPIWRPPEPPRPKCDSPNTCLPRSPDYCAEDETVVQNCGLCGCPAGFECASEDTPLCPEGQECITDGGCYKAVESVGLKCFNNNYVIGPGLNCSQIGPSFYDFFENDPLKRNLNAFVGVKVKSTFGGKKKIKKGIMAKLAAQKLCIDTTDLGCVPKDTKCPGEVAFRDNFNEVIVALQTQINRLFSGAGGTPLGAAATSSVALGSGVATGLTFAQIGAVAGPAGYIVGFLIGFLASLIASAFVSVDISYGINSAQVELVQPKVTYPCDALLIGANESCSPVLYQGDPEDKVDLLFIADGFESELELNRTISSLLDYGGNASGTIYEGLFSRAPFKQEKSAFNIWVVSSGGVNYSKDPIHPSRGAYPDLKQLQKFATNCPDRDVVVFLSAKEKFQSDCGLDPVTSPCMLSLPSEPHPGRALLQLMGRAIGKLSFEWYFEIEPKVIPSRRVDEFSLITVRNSPNCKANRAAAQKEWGSLLQAGGTIGFYDGCGGVCGKDCASYIRPTRNSVMNNVTQRCTDSCREGPPYDPFYLVNEQAILEGIQNFASPVNAHP
ncbi:hypothetical protein D6825_03610 [Candidatus Woesearchaeota archaeon]|nr:MAG: hypothetical protein D6825_03610 [Candidatus Woesearchaeota archaeon]